MKNLIFTLSLALSANAFAADIEAGKKIAAGCAACHGGNGISTAPMWPNLAGQKAQYTVIQLKAFKSGERKNAIMQGIASGLSDTDMDNVAAYFASLK
jgi:cytochrome c553